MVVGTVTGGAVLVVVVVVGMVTGGVGTVGGWVVLGVDVGVPAPPCRVTAPDGVTPIGPMASNTAAAAEVSKRARPGARVLEQSRALMPLSPTMRIEFPLRTPSQDRVIIPTISTG